MCGGHQNAKNDSIHMTFQIRLKDIIKHSCTCKFQPRYLLLDMNIFVRASSAFENIFQTRVSRILHASWCWKHKEDSLCHLVDLRLSEVSILHCFTIVSVSVFLSSCLLVFSSFVFLFCLSSCPHVKLGKASTLHCFIDLTHYNKQQ